LAERWPKIHGNSRDLLCYLARLVDFMRLARSLTNIFRSIQGLPHLLDDFYNKRLSRFCCRFSRILGWGSLTPWIHV
jgi:hypothetical protein